MHAAHGIKKFAVGFDAKDLDHIVLSHGLCVGDGESAVIDRMEEWTPDVDLPHAALQRPWELDVSHTAEFRYDGALWHVKVDLLREGVRPLAILGFGTLTAGTAALLLEDQNLVNSARFAAESVTDELHHLLVAIDVLDLPLRIPFRELADMLLEDEAVLFESELGLAAADIRDLLEWAIL